MLIHKNLMIKQAIFIELNKKYYILKLSASRQSSNCESAFTSSKMFQSSSSAFLHLLTQPAQSASHNLFLLEQSDDLVVPVDVQLFVSGELELGPAIGWQ